MQIFKAAQEMGLETPDELAAIALDPRCSFKAKFAWALLHSLTFSRGTFVLGTLLFPIAVASSVYKAVSYFIRFFGS